MYKELLCCFPAGGQCSHELGTHGKLQLISAGSWILLTELVVFKPTAFIVAPTSSFTKKAKL